MKRITVALTLAEDSWNTANDLRKIKTAMINAGVAKATELDSSIANIDAKVGHVRKVK